MLLRKVRGLLQRIAHRLARPVDRWAYKRYYEFPFGDSPRASAEVYREIWQATKGQAYPMIDAFEEKLGFSVAPDWFHDLALQTQVVVKESAICYQHGRLLYSALSAYIAQHDGGSLTLLETGTARGFSSLCLAKALHDADKPGTLVTFDVLPHDTTMYWNCIADAEGTKTRAELLHNYQPLIEEHIIFVQGNSALQLKKINLSRVHFAFLDGAHTYENVLGEFAFLQDKQKTGDIIFFDDYTAKSFPGIVQAVDEICAKHGYSKEVIMVSEERGYVVARKH